MGDDPLIPPNTTADGQTFRDWVDFVDRVARPLVEDDADWDGELGDLYRKASPYFICMALLMAYNRAHPEPTRFDLDDRSTWPEDGQRVPDCVAELAWYVKARGYDDTLARWVAFRRGEDKWVVSDRLRDRFLVDWEWCYLTDDVEPDRFATASVLNLIPPLMLGEARARWSKRIPDVDLLYVVAGHADGPEVDC